jgi:hypothetical protein
MSHYTNCVSDNRHEQYIQGVRDCMVLIEELAKVETKKGSPIDLREALDMIYDFYKKSRERQKTLESAQENNFDYNLPSEPNDRGYTLQLSPVGEELPCNHNYIQYSDSFLTSYVCSHCGDTKQS